MIIRRFTLEFGKAICKINLFIGIFLSSINCTGRNKYSYFNINIHFYHSKNGIMVINLVNYARIKIGNYAWIIEL
jgi:hypothetical protein